MRWLSLIIALLIFSCSKDRFFPEVKSEAPKEVVGLPTVTLIDGVRELFCFKCHSYERFSGGGRFPHERHRGFYHCNQCHRIKMHSFISTDTSICKTCHELGRITYTASGMKTYFDHEGHSKRNACRDCHPEVFVMKKGMNRITMEEINKGRFCGLCHNGKRAFGADLCNACHEMG